MPDWQLKTPVAFIIFNRPATTERVFAEIAKAKPPKLLVVADGPRKNRANDAENCAAVRAVIDRVNWDCEVLKNFSDHNLGCRLRVSSGIDWVFEQVEEAIILEDDCLPDPTFFRFCQDLLDRYRHDSRIGVISGDNFQFNRRRNNDSYYFSKYVHIWGWATWRDRWVGHYDVSMSNWPRIRDEGWLVDMVGSKREARYWHRIFEHVRRGKIDAWDYQWFFANLLEGRTAILPTVNLISNIGFGANATNTKGSSNVANLPLEPMIFPLKHPIGLIRDVQADRFSETKCFRVPFIKRVLNRLIGFIQQNLSV